MRDKYGFKSRKRWPWLGELDPNDVVVPDIRVTAVMPPELEEQFRGSIRAQGVLNPIKCIWDGENIILVDGLHRLMEARASGLRTVPAIVVPGKIKDVMLQNLTTGKLQGRGKVTEMIRVVKYLVEEEHMSLEDIAVQSGYKLRYLEDLLAIARAHPDLLRALDEELIPLGAAKELARIKEPEVMLRLLYQVIQYRMKVQDVKELVDKTLEVLEKKKKEKKEGKKPRPRGEVEIECFVCGEKYPAAMMRSPILCPACMNILFQVKAERRAMMAQVKEEISQTASAPSGGSGQTASTSSDSSSEIEIEIQPSSSENFMAKSEGEEGSQVGASGSPENA